MIKNENIAKKLVEEVLTFKEVKKSSLAWTVVQRKNLFQTC